MIDIKSYFIALKASWVSRLVTGHISNWKLRMNLLDKVFVASKISLTYIKSLLSNFQKQ
jgi:hypothetical protein